MKTTKQNAMMGMGEATEVEFPVARIAAGAAVVGATFAAIDLAKSYVETTVLGKRSFPDFDIEVSLDKEKNVGKAKFRDAATLEAQREEIREAKKAVKDAQKALKKADGKEEKKEARKDLQKAERALERLLDPENVDLTDVDDDEEEAA